VLEYKKLYVDKHCHGGALYWMPEFHTYCSEWPYAVPPTLYISDIIVVPCCMNSTISTPFLSQKMVAIRLLASRRLFNLYNLFGERVCIHCFGCSLVSTFTNETQVSSSVTHIMWLRNLSPSLWYCSKNQSRSYSLHFVRTHEYFRNTSCTKLAIVSLKVIIPQRIVREICGNSHESSEIVKHRLSHIFWSTLWTRSLLTTEGQPLRSSLWTFVCLSISEHPTPLSYSSFTHYILAMNRV
jgi:hypothetical protein